MSRMQTDSTMFRLSGNLGIAIVRRRMYQPGYDGADDMHDGPFLATTNFRFTRELRQL